MANGHELFIGFKGKEKINEVAAALDIEIEWNTFTAEITSEDVHTQINEKLRKAWLEAIADIGLTVVSTDNPRYPIINTPMGRRQMVPWHLELEYDAIETDADPSTAILGVSLISRYFPTFLDWHEEHGGSGSVISLDTETLGMIQRARLHISNAYSIFVTADLHIKELHY